MVRFIFGGTGSGKSEYVFRDVKRTLDETDRRVCVIVPEQFTVSVESRLAGMTDPRHTLRLEVTNFTRLSDSVSRTVGGLSYTRLTKGAKMLVLWRAMISVFPALTELSKIEGDDTRVIPSLFAAQRELTLGGITPERLAKASDELSADGEALLSARARDLALICSAAESILSDELGGVCDPVEKLARDAFSSGYFDNTSIYIDSFYSLTGAEKKALGELVRSAADVTVTVPMDSPAATGVHLYGVRDMYSSVLSAALKYGDGAPENVVLEGNRRASSRELGVLQSHLWDYSFTGEDSDLPSVPESVSVWSVANRYEEAEALASHVASLVRDGASYGDIAVVCANVASIRGITDSVLRRHGIPCFVSEQTLIMNSPAVRLILSMLKIPGAWRTEDVVSVVKTGLSPLTEDEACTFESYVDVWNIRGARAFSSVWNMNPDGYVERLTERGKWALLTANDAREKLIPHLEKFVLTFEGGKATVKAVCEAIVGFFDEAGAYAKMTERASRLPADDGEREKLVWREICAAFDTMVDVLGEAEVSPTSFASLFRYVIADAGTGAIPTGIDEVTIAGASSLRTDGVRHVTLLGADEGEFPAMPKNEGFFTDADKEKLEGAGVILSADTETRASEELFRFYRAVSQASETLTVFVPSVIDRSVRTPSRGTVRICELTGVDLKHIEKYPLGTPDTVFDEASLRDACRTGDDAAKMRGIYRKIYGRDAEIVREVPESRISPATADRLFGTNLTLSKSRINCFVGCPMSYYGKYVLNLSEDKEAKIDAVDIGNFVHSVLEQFFALTAGREYPIPDEEADRICEDIVKKYVESCFGGAGSGRLDYMFVKLKRTVRLFISEVMKEMAQGSFEVFGTELPIGDRDAGEAPPAITFRTDDGTTVRVVGVIDRLDIYRRESDGKAFIRIVDYKTSKKEFSYSDVQRGIDVQLLVYLFSAWKAQGTKFESAAAEGLQLAPAGAGYLTLRAGEKVLPAPITEEESYEKKAEDFTRSGIFIDDEDVIRAADREKSGRYVSLKESDLATLERFGEMYSELGETLCSVAERMKTGEAPAEPLDGGRTNACRYCVLKDTCKNFRDAKY